MLEKIKSPVVWGVLFAEILTQLEILRNGNANCWTIAISICTVLVAFFGALNNPNDRSNF